jgi:signal transduction histidine kinase
MEMSPELTRQGKSFEPVLELMRREVAERSKGAEMSAEGMRLIVRSGTGKPVKFKFRSGRTIEARANPIPEVGAVFTVADITEALRTEGRVRQNHKLEALGDLAGGVAHEYNNLLTSIQGFARMALKKMNDEDRVRESLQEIIEASGRATEITQQMLAFSKKQVLMPVVVDVGETISDMEPVLRVFIQSNLDIGIDIKSKGYASIDPALLNACIGNLVKNSRQAMPNGGTVTIVCDTAEFDETFVTSHGDKLAPGRYVSVAVTDTGRGMDPKVLAHIFDPFFTTRDVGAGTGLGLSMVFGMAKNHNGAVDVESSPGNGATFTIYLPQVPAPSDQTADDAAADAATVANAEPPALPQDPPPTIDLSIVPSQEDAENLMRFL